MSDIIYKVYIEDPKSNSEENIKGSIILSDIGFEKVASGELSGLPELTVNGVSNFGKIGPIKGQPSLTADGIILANEMLNLLINEVSGVYLIDLRGRLKYEDSETPEIIKPEQNIEQQEIGQLETEPPKKYIFDVSKEGYFTNIEFGELKVVDDGFIFSDFDDESLIGDEYIETPFEGISEEDIRLEEEKGENIGTEREYESGSIETISDRDKSTWSKIGTVVNGSKVPTDIANPPRYNLSVSINDTIKKDYIPEINKIKASYGTKLLAILMAQKEGFTTTSRSFRTNNPGNIGNTDSGINKYIPTLKDGIQLQIDYINKVASGGHPSYPIGKRKYIPPYYSPEIANNPSYGLTPFLPGYDFTYTGKIEEYVKIYATGARAGNSYIGMIVSWFRKNGYDWVNEETTIAELIKIEVNPHQTAAVIV